MKDKSFFVERFCEKKLFPLFGENAEKIVDERRHHDFLLNSWGLIYHGCRLL